MQRLSVADYDSVRSLFTPLRYNLVIDSILDGNTHGRVYADDPTPPRTAVVWNGMKALGLSQNLIAKFTPSPGSCVGERPERQ
ncbi:MAG: hypothetical protein DYG89_29030 [Caldilinea sp. CFX5]|nr:hypothetical protein [Caldilinea sp. CFX5]